jgi:hypothetical protein
LGIILQTGIILKIGCKNVSRKSKIKIIEKKKKRVVKIVKKLSKSCQKVVEKMSKSSKSSQKVGKKLSKSCQIAKNWPMPEKLLDKGNKQFDKT